MHIFIDTNVLLSFYHYSDDDLEELRKLVVLLQKKMVSLHIPTQVRAEFVRNRDTKVADAIKRLKDQKLNLKYPQIGKDYPEYASLRKLQKAYEAEHLALVNKLSEDAKAFKLKADQIISQLFELADEPSCADAIFTSAQNRVALGNPPGKSGSLGDAVNWEALLHSVPVKSELHFISGDGDYCSALDEDVFSTFLLNEWQSKKKSSLRFYRRLSAFFKEHFPEITLATELEKDLLIADLAASGNLARTHTIVDRLSKFSEFSTPQLNAIAQAVVSNNQVYMIAEDDDVKAFLQSTVIAKPNDIDSALYESVAKHAGVTDDDEDDIPF